MPQQAASGGINVGWGRDLRRTFSKPIAVACVRKHCRQRNRWYLRMMPVWLPQTRLRTTTCRQLNYCMDIAETRWNHVEMM